MKDSYEIKPIGVIYASGQGAALELLPPYRPGLRQLDQFSHVLVFWWADQHDTPEDRNGVQCELPYARGTTAGVFACRSEYRPNPIAVTTCPILDVDEDRGLVTLPWIDAFDGTPLLDLKPYIPISERIRDVRVASWFADWPEWMEDAAEFFSKAKVDFGE